MPSDSRESASPALALVSIARAFNNSPDLPTIAGVVGANVSVGLKVGANVSLGANVAVGEVVGLAVGEGIGASVGEAIGASVGEGTGATVGPRVPIPFAPLPVLAVEPDIVGVKV